MKVTPTPKQVSPKTEQVASKVIQPHSTAELSSMSAQFTAKNGHSLVSVTMAKLNTSDIVAFISIAQAPVDGKRLQKVESPTNPAK